MSSKRKIKDKKVTLWKVGEYEDDMGLTQQGIVKVGKVWAYIRDLSAKERQETILVKERQDLKVQIANKKDIDTSWKVSYKDRVYSIVAIDRFEWYDDDIVLSVEYLEGATVEQLENGELPEENPKNGGNSSDEEDPGDPYGL